MIASHVRVEATACRGYADSSFFSPSSTDLPGRREGVSHRDLRFPDTWRHPVQSIDSSLQRVDGSLVSGSELPFLRIPRERAADRAFFQCAQHTCQTIS